MAVIQPISISGREVARLLGEQPFTYNVNGIDRSCYDLWQLCHSANLNVWAKNSPLTYNGAKWSAPGYVANPINAVEQWNYYSPTGYDANLSHFANYTDEYIPPVSLGFPPELVQGVNNSYFFSISLMIESEYHISFEDVFPTNTYGKLYPCICIDDLSGVYIWCAGDTIPDIDLTPYFNGKSQLRITYCMSDVPKELDAPNISGCKFYSLRFIESLESTKIIPYRSIVASGLILNITSGFVADRSLVSFEKLNEDIVGLYCIITDQNGNTLPDATITADIGEDNGNTKTITLTRTSGSEYVNTKDTFISAFDQVNALHLTVYRNGKSERKDILAKQSPVSRVWTGGVVFFI